MKSIIKTIVFTALFLEAITCSLQAQTISRYGEWIVEDPAVNNEIKVVVDYFNALVSVDLGVAKSLLTEYNMSTEPGAIDSNNFQKEVFAWSENYRTQMNRKIEFTTLAYKENLGNFSSKWIGLIGIYSCEIDGVNLTIPVQITAFVEKGKNSKKSISFDNLGFYSQQNLTFNPTEK